MNTSRRQDLWAKGEAYESYVGRWSRPVAREFLRWVAAPPAARWLDFGCGTGGLAETVLQDAAPGEVIGLDPAEAFIAHARERVTDRRCRFVVGDASALQGLGGEFDMVVSGLVLNFVPQPEAAMAAIVDVLRRGGRLAAYVWDYAGRMELMRYFWDAAVALDPQAAALDEGVRFPVCRPDRLTALLRGAGLRDVTTTSIDIPTVFRDFDDYWTPFLSGQGPAPGYCASLSEPRRVALREHLHSSLPVRPDGSISLIARAFAVQGIK